MAHKIVIFGKAGQLDSLKAPISVVFTLTPMDFGGATSSYDPVVLATMLFDNSSDRAQELELGTRLGFSTYSVEPANSGFLSRIQYVIGASRNCCLLDDEPIEFAEGEHRAMATVTSGRPIQWAPAMAASNATKRFSISNETPSTQRIALSCRRPGSALFSPIVAYHPLRTGERVSASPALRLQAYEVSGDNFGSSILTPDLRSRPLLDQPIHCNELPTLSAWKLTQEQGVTRLVPGDHSITGLFNSIQALANSFNDMRAQLNVVVASAANSQSRLAALEGSVIRNQSDLSEAQKSLADTRNQVDRLPDVQTRTTELETSFASSEERITVAEQSITEARADLVMSQQATDDLLRQLLEVHESATAASGGFSAVREQVDRIPDVEAKLEKLAESLVRTRDDVSAVQKSSLAVNDRLSDAEISITNNRHSISDLADRSTPPIDSKTETSGPNYSDAQAMQESLVTVRQQVANLDRRLPVVEGRAEKLAKAFGQTLENLTSVNNYLRTARQQINGLDAKLPALELQVQASSEAVINTGERLVGLDLRVAAVETRTETLQESLSKIQEPGGGGWVSAPGSPTIFPDRGSGMGLPPDDLSKAEPFPWLSVPQPLDGDFPALPTPQDL